MNQIVDNLAKRSNHRRRLQRWLSRSTEVLIVSPFLMEDLSSVLNTPACSGLGRITLVTTLIPGSPDQFRKIHALKSLFDGAGNCQVDLLIDNRLHGKVYVFSRNGSPIVGIVTSANMTNKGLSRNHEWGVEIRDTHTLVKLVHDTTHGPWIGSLNVGDVTRMYGVASEYARKHPKVLNNRIDLNLLDLLPEEHRPGGGKYWLKPIGWNRERISTDRTFGSARLRLGLARRPRSMNPGDIAIVYGVGPRKVLTICEVLTRGQFRTKQEIQKHPRWKRWPWYVVGRNLTPRYGKTWASHHLALRRLRETYQASHTDKSLTWKGGTSLGALNYGSDKVRLADAFAEYIIKQVQTIEK